MARGGEVPCLMGFLSLFSKDWKERLTGQSVCVTTPPLTYGVRAGTPFTMKPNLQRLRA